MVPTGPTCCRSKERSKGSERHLSKALRVRPTGGGTFEPAGRPLFCRLPDEPNHPSANPIDRYLVDPTSQGSE